MKSIICCFLPIKHSSQPVRFWSQLATLLFLACKTRGWTENFWRESCHPDDSTYLVIFKQAFKKFAWVLKKTFARFPVIVYLRAWFLSCYFLWLDSLHNTDSFNHHFHSKWRALHCSHLNERVKEGIHLMLQPWVLLSAAEQS